MPECEFCANEIDRKGATTGPKPRWCSRVCRQRFARGDKPPYRPDAGTVTTLQRLRAQRKYEEHLRTLGLPPDEYLERRASEGWLAYLG